ncbi:hypothetical protein [Pelagibius sp.]|uniref:hypothetical protein n=1 Tax=Pelagibius sp. TaxID=1931238 RepID=UPI00260E44F0|nr:hypothetical protein [Pelagibius sp.]
MRDSAEENGVFLEEHQQILLGLLRIYGSYEKLTVSLARSGLVNKSDFDAIGFLDKLADATKSGVPDNQRSQSFQRADQLLLEAYLLPLRRHVSISDRINADLDKYASRKEQYSGREKIDRAPARNEIQELLDDTIERIGRKLSRITSVLGNDFDQLLTELHDDVSHLLTIEKDIESFLIQAEEYEKENNRDRISKIRLYCSLFGVLVAAIALFFGREYVSYFFHWVVSLFM